MKILYAVPILAVFLLAGCGDNTRSMVEGMNKVRDSCRGTLTMSVTVGSFSDSLTISCTEDASDEARAKRKEGK